MEKYIMKRTEILCVECKKGYLMHEKGRDIYCDKCGEKFEFINNDNIAYRYKQI